MSASFDFPTPDLFTTGAVGPPGQRVFYLQARQDGLIASLRLEKQQVALLAQYLEQLLADLPAVDPASLPADLDLVEPLVAEWVVGQIGLGHDEENDRILLLAEELVFEEDESDEADDVDFLAEHPDLGSARFALTRPQAAAFIARAGEIVPAGRPACPLCGQPMNPEGHLCPRSNGHKPH